MYEKRTRTKKEKVQTDIVIFFRNNTRKHTILKGGSAISLSGPDPINAIRSLRGVDPKCITLYETDKNNYEEARCELNRHYEANKLKNILKQEKKFYKLEKIFLSNSDIYSKLHDDCSCFYYDFCATYKSINWAHIAAEFKNQMKLNRSFSVVYTLSLRPVSLKETKEFVSNFNKELLQSNSSYKIKQIKRPLTYHGGANGKGAPMYVWAGIFLKGDEMSKNLREKHPGLFGLDNNEMVEEIKEEKTMKRTSKQTTTHHNSTDMQKEMVHVLLSKKNRNYTNSDIAEMTGLSARQVAAMAAWHSGKLAEKRK